MKLPYNAHEHVYFNMVLSKILYHVRHIPKFTLKVAWRIFENKINCHGNNSSPTGCKQFLISFLNSTASNYVIPQIL
jgi:hypothetical protein